MILEPQLELARHLVAMAGILEGRRGPWNDHTGWYVGCGEGTGHDGLGSGRDGLGSGRGGDVPVAF